MHRSLAAPLLFALLLLLPFAVMAQDYNVAFSPRAVAAAAGWTNVGTFLAANHITSLNPWAPTTSATLTAGHLGVCVIEKDDTGSSTTDGAGNAEFTSLSDGVNTWIEAYEWCEMGPTSAAADGACVAVYYTDATTTLSSGSALTVTFAGAAVAKAMTCEAFTPPGAASDVITIDTPVGHNFAGSLPQAQSISPTGVAREHLFIRGIGCGERRS